MDSSVSSDQEDVLNEAMVFPFEYLPDLVLDHIFSYLSISDKINAEYVSKLWFHLSRRSWVHVREFDTSWIKYPVLKPFSNAQNTCVRLVCLREKIPVPAILYKRIGQNFPRYQLFSLMDSARLSVVPSCEHAFATY